MACATSVALLSHGHGQRARFSSGFFFPRSRVGVCNQDIQLRILTKRPEGKPHELNRIRAQSTLSSPQITSELLNMPFFERLKLAWQIIFPKTPLAQSSNAQIAKQRLKMVLFSDRCAVSDLAKKKILENVVKTLSEFVEIEAQDKVELNVSTDSEIGTVYSVTVPVRRVKTAFQENDENYKGQIVGIDYKDTGRESGIADVTFSFYAPDEN